MRLNRRSFLQATLAAMVPGRAAGRRITLSRVSAITDEIARSPAAAIDFAHAYGLQWLSLRDMPAELGTRKSAYYSLALDALKQAAREFSQAGIQIAFLDTPFLKFGLPGTEPKRKTPEDPAARERRIAREKSSFDRRLDDLRQGIRAAQAFDCPRLRIFTFSRLAEPESVFPRIADIIGEMSSVAEKDGV